MSALLKRNFRFRSRNIINSISKPRNYSSQIEKSKILGNKLFVWGDTQYSSLGLGENENNTCIPTEIADIDGSGYKDIALGKHHAAIVTGKGDLYMFGTSAHGEIGVPDENKSNEPIPLYQEPVHLKSLSNIKQVSCGEHHTLCLDESGNVYSWGWGGSMGLFGMHTSCSALGHGHGNNVNEPQQIEALSNIMNISCGNQHSLCCNDKGELFGFGEGKCGRLGNGANTDCLLPHKSEWFMANNMFVERVFGGGQHSIVMTRQGFVFGFGQNASGQLGNGEESLPILMGDEVNIIPEMIDLHNIVNIDCSDHDTLCVDIDGNVYHFGGRLYTTPHCINDARFVGGNKAEVMVKDVAISSNSMCFVTQNGELYTCSTKVKVKSNIFALGDGVVQAHKDATRVIGMDDECVQKVALTERRCIAIAK